MSDASLLLFLDNKNASCSILAESLLKQFAPERFATYSAGVVPAGNVEPLVNIVLKENFNVDASKVRSKSWEEFKTIHFDFIITLCDEARLACPAWPGQPVIIHWHLPDPCSFQSTEGKAYWEMLEATKQIQHCIERFADLPLATMNRTERISAIREISVHQESALV